MELERVMETWPEEPVLPVGLSELEPIPAFAPRHL
jgi:hypothetical protein